MTDRQTDGRLFSFIYIDRLHKIFSWASIEMLGGKESHQGQYKNFNKKVVISLIKSLFLVADASPTGI